MHENNTVLKVTFMTSNDAFFTLDVAESAQVSDMLMMIGIEAGMPNKPFKLSKNGRQLNTDPKRSVKEIGIENCDLILVIPMDSTTEARNHNSDSSILDFRSINLPESSNNSIESARRSLLAASPQQLSLLRDRNPELADAINDPDSFHRIFNLQQESARKHREELEMLSSADPLDPSVQAKIAELIRQKNIDTQMESALEYYPETFGQVTMLFIDCKIKDVPIKAFVDSGAQSTLMSEECARRCNMYSLIDTRWAGKAYGIGTQTIIGRVHSGSIEIQRTFLPTSFIVLKDQSMDLLIGLDMLKRHQCCIDLRRNVLVIDNGRVEAPFLPESEIPVRALNLSLLDEEGSSNSTSSTGPSLNESQQAKVQQLISRGIPRSKAIDELRFHEWNLDAALASYLQKMMD